MKGLLLTSIAALFLATGAAHAYDAAKDYRPQYDTRPWEAAQPPDEPEPFPRSHPRKPLTSTYIKERLSCFLEEGFKQDGWGMDGYQCGIDPNKLTAIQRRCMQAAIAVSEPADDNRDDIRNDKKMQAAYDRCLAKAKAKPTVPTTKECDEQYTPGSYANRKAARAARAKYERCMHANGMWQDCFSHMHPGPSGGCVWRSCDGNWPAPPNQKHECRLGRQ